jgi:WD40 repeat protein
MAEANFDKATLAWTLPWDPDWVSTVAFVGRRLFAGNNRGELLAWDLLEKPGDPLPPAVLRLEGHTNAITRLLVTPDGRWLISASYDHTIRYWDMQAEPAGEEQTILLNPRAREEKRGAKPAPAVEAKVRTLKAAKVLQGHKDWILGLTMTADGNTLISGDDGGQVVVWDRAEGKELRRWKVKGWVFALAVSPDAKQLLVSERVPLIFDSGRYHAVKLWDLAEGKVQHDMSAAFKDAVIGSAVFAPDGKTLFLGRAGEANGNNGKVFTVDPAAGKRLKEFTPGHQDGLTDLAFHPDGKHLASSGRDTVVRIWNAADGKMVKEVGKPRGGQFKDWIHSLAFTTDGMWMAAADIAGAVQVWSFNS